MYKDKLIHNHFDIQFDDNNVYFVSLLHDDFDYLKDAPIKRYKEDYIEVYNFLYQIQNLYERELIKIEDGKAVITVDNFINLEKDVLRNLWFSEPVDFSLIIKDRGIISYKNFHLEYKITDDKYKDSVVVGCFIVQNNTPLLMCKHLYELFKSINLINNIPDEDPNRETLIWEHINNIKEKAPFTHSTLSGFYNDEQIIIPSTMQIDIKEDEKHNIELKMSLDALDEEQQLKLQERYETLIDVQPTYSFKINEKKCRVILSPKIKENLIRLKETPKKIRREKDKAELLKDPSKIFIYPEVVSLDNFSDRVINFGLYQNIATTSRESSGIGWNFPIYRVVYTISGEPVELKIIDKDDMHVLKELLHRAITDYHTYIIYHNVSIPLSENNLTALKDFLVSPEDIIEAEGKQVQATKKIQLIDQNGFCFNTVINDELIESLKQEINEFRASGKVTDSIKIDGRIVPLSKENIKPLIKILEIHLIIDEDYANITTLNEELMLKYCDPVELPPDMKSHVKQVDGKVKPLSLKAHQLKGLQWLQNSYKMRDIGRTGVLLADDMGLGKTLQVLSFIFWLKEKYPNNFNTLSNKPVLIVAPVILLENWKQEYYKFFTDSLGEPLILHGDTLRRLRTDDGTSYGKEYYQITDKTGSPKIYLDTKTIRQSNIVITNYDTVVNYEFSLASIDWSCIILDEAQSIKEEQSLKSRILKGFKSEFKIACTGTPVENKLTDLWNIFDFLQPNLLGTRKEFTKEFNDKNMTGTKYKDLRNKFFYDKPYAFILRRIKSLELKDSLTNKYIKTHNVQMSKVEENLYINLKNEMLDSSSPLQILAKMNKLSQHPRLINCINDYNVAALINESPKLQKLIEILEDIKGKKEKVIIFALYHEMQKYLKLVLEEKFNLDNIGIINGDSNSTTGRQKQIDKFQETPRLFNILILSPLAAGVGLNITGANHVIHYSRWWNPAKESQATDRVYRIGQSKDVYVHYLINKFSTGLDPTFDENLHNLLSSKIELAENFLLPNNIDVRDSLIDKIAHPNTK